MVSRTIEELYDEAAKCYHEYDYENALGKVNKILALDKINNPGRALKACILIDSWDGSDKTQAKIMEALSYLKDLINDDPDKKWGFLGNMGNAYLQLAESQLKTNKNILNKKIMKDLIKSKDCYQESLELNENQPHIWINKGNLLDIIGRHLEAIECYDRAILIDNKHYNSWGNRGLCCLRLSNSATNEEDRKLLYVHAMKYIGIELMLHPDFSISEGFKSQVQTFLSENKIEINLDIVLKELLPKKTYAISDEFNIYDTIDLSFKEFFTTFCEAEGFFLNIHFDCNNCGCSQLDLIDFSFISSIDEHKSDYNFFKRLYTIMDDYATARFLLALAQYRSKDFVFLDKQRYEPDYSLNYIHNVELLKESFIKIITICDKIAFFLKDYENLTRKDGTQIDERNISFWFPNSIFTVSDILEKNDYQTDLAAMDSIRNDLEKGEFKNLRLIRDYLVHRYFILHDIVDPKLLTYPYDPKREPLEDLKYHDDIENFYRMTKKSLRLMRNMLFSLSFFVDYKERQKKSATSGPVVKLNWSYTPQDDESNDASGG